MRLCAVDFRRTCTLAATIGAGLLFVSAAHAHVGISSYPTKNMVCSAGVCSPTKANAVLNVGDLTGMLASGDVTVTTGSAPLAPYVKDIVVAKAFSWTSSHSLTLDAHRSVNVNKSISVAGPGELNFKFNDGGSDGLLRFGPAGNVTFFSTSNALTINGARYTLLNSLPSLASAVRANPAGHYALANSYDASADVFGDSPIQSDFTGTFQGLGNSISHMTIHDPMCCSLEGVGLFAGIDTGGTVCGIHLNDVKIKTRKMKVIGSLAGGNRGLICNASAWGMITSPSAIGGLVGSSSGTLREDRAAVTIYSGAGASGGLAGENVEGGIVRESYATGTVNGAGGLIGANESSSVIDSYALGSVAGDGDEAGGLFGANSGSVSTSYAAGVVGGNARFPGGVVGGNSGVLSQTYWDIDTTGIDQGCGIGDCTGATGLTDAQLKSGLPAGFDPTIWAESPSINNGLPYLLNNPPPS